MVAQILLNVLVTFRCFFNYIVDYIAELYWKSERVKIPNIVKNSTILLESATTLASQIRLKKLKSEDIVKAYIERIREVNPLINAVTDERYEEAIQEAQAVDQKISAGVDEETFKTKPYFGVPFTAKLSFDVKGLNNSRGILSRKNFRADEDADAIRLMKEAGGIILGVTNVPEFVRWQETFNYAHGLTRNPYDTTRTVGGSTGGEGALISSAGSPLGLCSDLGGSTRMPAFFCGLFAHNPTAGTTSMKGSLLQWSENIETFESAGVMSRRAEDLAPVMKILAGDKADKLNLDRPFDIKKIKVYYMEKTGDLSVSEINGELKAALKSVVHKLSEASGSPAIVYHTAGFNYMVALWKYWIVNKDPADFIRIFHTPEGWSVSGIVELIKKPFGLSEYTLGTILSLIDAQLFPIASADWAESTTKQLQDDLIDKLGTDGVLIFPSAPRCAPHHYTSYLRPTDLMYWSIWNALKFPATQVPLGLNSSGLPLGVQVVAAPYNDGLSIKVAQHLEKVFGGYVPPCKVSS